VRAAAAEQALVGHRMDEEVAREAAAAAVKDVKPLADIHGGSDYRRRVLEALVRRALLLATSRVAEERQ
jgi:CO/xanthine dehydrogenase FAD-binding subunit